MRHTKVVVYQTTSPTHNNPASKFCICLFHRHYGCNPYFNSISNRLQARRRVMPRSSRAFSMICCSWFPYSAHDRVQKYGRTNHRWRNVAAKRLSVVLHLRKACSSFFPFFVHCSVENGLNFSDRPGNYTSLCRKLEHEVI